MALYKFHIIIIIIINNVLNEYAQSEAYFKNSRTVLHT